MWTSGWSLETFQIKLGLSLPALSVSKGSQHPPPWLFSSVPSRSTVHVSALQKVIPRLMVAQISLDQQEKSNFLHPVGSGSGNLHLKCPWSVSIDGENTWDIRSQQQIWWDESLQYLLGMESTIHVWKWGLNGLCVTIHTRRRDSPQMWILSTWISGSVLLEDETKFKVTVKKKSKRNSVYGKVTCTIMLTSLKCSFLRSFP